MFEQAQGISSRKYRLGVAILAVLTIGIAVCVVAGLVETARVSEIARINCPASPGQLAVFADDSVTLICCYEVYFYRPPYIEPERKYAVESPISDLELRPLAKDRLLWLRSSTSKSDRASIFVIDVARHSQTCIYQCEVGWDITAVVGDATGTMVGWAERPMMVASLQSRIKAFDLNQGQLVCEIASSLLNPNQSINTLAFDQGKNYLALGCISGANAVGLADIKKSRVLWHRKTLDSSFALAFMPDGKSFFSVGACGEVNRYDSANGQELSKWIVPAPFSSGYKRDRLHSVAVNKQGTRLAVATDFSAEVIVWRIQTGELEFSFPASRNTCLTAFGSSPNSLWYSQRGQQGVTCIKLPDEEGNPVEEGGPAEPKE